METQGLTNEELNSFAMDVIADAADRSVAHLLDELELHIHNAEKAFGNSSNDMLEDEPVKFTVVGGDNAWGTELMLTDGTVIESGDATKKLDLDTLYIVSVSAANKISVLEILYSDINTGVACTFTFTGGTVEDQVDAVGHGLANGDKVVFEDGGGVLPAEINEHNVYYVINKGTDYFNISLTSGGSKFAFTDDGGACFFFPINSAGVAQGAVVQSVMTDTIISMSAVNNDSFPFRLKSPRVGTNQRIFIRAKSETGQTISIGFLIGLHVYDA